jgi:hypothetical protein
LRGLLKLGKEKNETVRQNDAAADAGR